jgi:hypothetical protein
VADARLQRARPIRATARAELIRPHA